jgi:DNA-binding NarL/FixJ family response regulator
VGLALWTCGCAQLAQGERARAAELWRQADELAERTRLVPVSLFATRSEVILAIVDGHLENALALIRQYVARADESGAPVRGRQIGAQMFITPALHLGRGDIWLTTFDEHAGPASLARPGRPAAFFIFVTAARAMCLAQLGCTEEALALVGPMLDDVKTGVHEDLSIGPLAILLQAALVLEHHAATRALATRLACVADLSAGAAGNLYTCVARHLGDAAVLAGNRAAAHAFYVQALEAAAKIRFRPEVALTHLRLAELQLKDNADRSEVLGHLDVAIPELRDMHMQPALERGLALLQQVEHQAPAPAGHAEVSRVLTGREQEVARLVAAGRSNREIAEALVITEGTVEVHIKHILGKLGFRSRAQVAGWFARQGSA